MKTLKERRGYGLGERNPKTQEYGAKGYESEEQDRQRSAHWASLLKEARADRLPRKYFH